MGSEKRFPHFLPYVLPKKPMDIFCSNFLKYFQERKKGEYLFRGGEIGIS
jgi:hypothetical protein